MFITLSYFDVMEAIQKHLENKNIKWKHNEYDDTWINLINQFGQIKNTKTARLLSATWLPQKRNC